MRLLQIGIAFVIASTACMADTITLKSGRVLNGTYLGGSAREVRVDVGDQIQTVNVSDISRIEFGGGASASSSSGWPQEESRPTMRRSTPPPPPPADDAPPTLRRSDSRSDSNVMRPPAGEVASAATRGLI